MYSTNCPEMIGLYTLYTKNSSTIQLPIDAIDGNKISWPLILK